MDEPAPGGGAGSLSGLATDQTTVIETGGMSLSVTSTV
jgi:hypothetical protein